MRNRTCASSEGTCVRKTSSNGSNGCRTKFIFVFTVASFLVQRCSRCRVAGHPAMAETVRLLARATIAPVVGRPSCSIAIQDAHLHQWQSPYAATNRIEL